MGRREKVPITQKRRRNCDADSTAMDTESKDGLPTRAPAYMGRRLAFALKKSLKPTFFKVGFDDCIKFNPFAISARFR